MNARHVAVAGLIVGGALCVPLALFWAFAFGLWFDLDATQLPWLAHGLHGGYLLFAGILGVIGLAFGAGSAYLLSQRHDWQVPVSAVASGYFLLFGLWPVSIGVWWALSRLPKT